MVDTGAVGNSCPTVAHPEVSKIADTTKPPNVFLSNPAKRIEPKKSIFILLAIKLKNTVILEHFFVS